MGAALEQARASGQRVEATGLRTETTTTYANPDGSEHQDSAHLPVRVRQSGVWVPVDTTLVSDAGGVHPRATVAGTVLSGGGSGSLVRLSTAGKTLGLGWLGGLPVPSLSGDTATYANVAAGTDLVVRATLTGFEQSLVLRQRPPSGAGEATVRLPLTVSGLVPSLSPDGVLTLTDSAGVVVLTGSPPVLYGSDRDAAGAPAHQASAVTRLVRTSGGGYELDVTPPAGFLADPSVQYPVTIDPSSTINMSSYAFIDSALPNQSYYNTGLSGTVHAGVRRGSINRSYFAFNVAFLIGANVTRAVFSAYQSWAAYRPAGVCDATSGRTTQLWVTAGFTSRA